jgi:hypothetical protein
VINKPFKVGQARNDDDVSQFLLYEFVVHARLADAELTGEQIVEIAEHLEDHEEAAIDAGAEGQPSEDEAALTNLDDVVDAAVASIETEPDSRGDSKR